MGSYIVLQADTVEQVWDSLKKDVFYASGEVVSARATSLGLGRGDKVLTA